MRKIVYSVAMSLDGHLAGPNGEADCPGKDIWLFGGGSLFRSLLDLALVDAIEVAVIPVLLGGGIPLPVPSRRTTLRLVGSKTYKTTGTVALEYAVEK